MGHLKRVITDYSENSNLGRIGKSLRCCIQALPVVCENKWPVLHKSYMTDEPWRLPLWQQLLSQPVRLLILELYSSLISPLKRINIIWTRHLQYRKDFLSFSGALCSIFCASHYFLYDSYLYRYVNTFRTKLKFASFANIVRIVPEKCHRQIPSCVQDDTGLKRVVFAFFGSSQK